MNIKLELIERETLDTFATKHNLTLCVRERVMDESQRKHKIARYYAFFEHTYAIEGETLLCSSYGNGNTVDAAIADYSKRISKTRLVVNAGGTNRREIQVPELIGVN